MSDWKSLNSSTTMQELSEDPWMTGHFQKFGGGSKKVAKAKLLEICKILGIPVTNKHTKPVLIENIVLHLTR